MARYRLLAKMFVAPVLYPAGSVIEYDGPPGPHLYPLDDAAEAAMETYFRENPHATLNPVEGLPKTMGADAPSIPKATLISEPSNVMDTLGTIATPGKATPGPTEGGRIPGEVPKVSVPKPSGATLSPPSIAPAVPEPETPIGRVTGDNPNLGDPTKPGEKGSENFDKAAEANTDAAKAGTKVTDLKV